MIVYTLVDSREIDRYENFSLFAKREDAQRQKESMGSDAHYFDIHKVEVIE
jgi:hypothetical protein